MEPLTTWLEETSVFAEGLTGSVKFLTDLPTRLGCLPGDDMVNVDRTFRKFNSGLLIGEDKGVLWVDLVARVLSSSKPGSFRANIRLMKTLNLQEEVRGEVGVTTEAPTAGSLA